MKVKYLFILTLLCILFIFPSQLQAQWYSLNTDYFIINFQEENAKAAYYLAEIVDDIHYQLVEFMDYKDESKTQIVIRDYYDLANGYANVNYFNLINIYLRQADFYSGMMGSYENWLKLLFIHEYTHILHLNINHGLASNYREFLGKVPFITTPNIFQPWWMIEGYSIYTESKYTDGGRVNSDIYDMYLLTAAAANKLYSLNQFHGKYNLSSWPGGPQAIYIYGQALFSYIVEKYGEEKLVKLSHVYSKKPQQGIDNIYQEVLGINLDTLYSNWQKQLEKKALKLKQGRDIENFPHINKLTNHGYYTIMPTIASNGKIAYYHYGDKFPALRILNQEGQDRQIITGVNTSGERMDFSADAQKIIYSKRDIHQRVYDYYDLYLYDFKQEKEIRLTKGARAYSPLWLNEQEIIFLSQKQGYTSIKLLDLKTKEISTILTVDINQSISHLALSPDKTKLLFSFKKDINHDIYLLSLKDFALKKVIVDEYTNVFPTWSPQGDYIVYSSNRKGNYNLYAYNLVSNNLYQLTDLFTGAFESDFRGEEEIIFTGYTASGYDLFSLENNLDNWKHIKKLEINEQEIEIDIDFKEKDWFKQLNQEFLIEEYNLKTSLSPKFIFPSLNFLIGENEAIMRTGLMTSGMDALEQHFYHFSFNYDSKAPVMDYNFDYSYLSDNYYLINFSLKQEAYFSRRNLSWLRDRKYQGALIYPFFMSAFSNHHLRFALTYQDILILNTEDLQQNIILSTGWQYNKVKGYNHFNNNTFVYLDLNFIPKLSNSIWITSLDYREYINFNTRNTLAYRIYLAISNYNSFRLRNLNFVRTYDNTSLANKMAVFNLEYRRNLLKINRGIAHYPLFFNNLNGHLFYDYGLIESNGEYESLQVIGAELGLELSQLYGMNNMEIIFGVSQGINEQEANIYLKLGKHF